VALIFVSYRRDDTQSATGRLCDKLQEHFDADQVFHDIESIEAGEDFAATITAKISASSAVLVMIGQHWLDATGPTGRSRLFEPGDYVCLEIAAALERQIPVIPVLVEDAPMPPASALPARIAALAGRQAHEITEQRWQYDSDLLVKRLAALVPSEREVTKEDTSTLRQALLQAVVGWPADFIQLLVHPRRHLAALVKQPNFVIRAAVFFAISHVIAASLFVVNELVASVTAFVLTGVPEGAFVLLLVGIPLLLAARLLRAPSHALSTMVMLGYIQSVVMIGIALGVALIWTGLQLVNPDIGSELRLIVYSGQPTDTRIARVTELMDAAITGPFLSAFVVANGIWLFVAGWLLVALAALRDMWQISRVHSFAILILTAGMLAVAGAFVVFAATL
jgi:hypothetical protein